MTLTNVAWPEILEAAQEYDDWTRPDPTSPTDGDTVPELVAGAESHLMPGEAFVLRVAKDGRGADLIVSHYRDDTWGLGLLVDRASAVVPAEAIRSAVQGVTAQYQADRAALRAIIEAS